MIHPQSYNKANDTYFSQVFWQNLNEQILCKLAVDLYAGKD